MECLRISRRISTDIKKDAPGDLEHLCSVFKINYFLQKSKPANVGEKSLYAYISEKCVKQWFRKCGAAQCGRFGTRTIGIEPFFYAVFASERTNAVFSELNTQTERTTSTYAWLNINIFEKPRISGLTSWQQPVKLWYCIIMGKIRIFRRRHVRKHRLTLWIPHFLRGTAAQGTRRQRIPQAGLRPHSMRHSENANNA